MVLAFLRDIVPFSYLDRYSAAEKPARAYKNPGFYQPPYTSGTPLKELTKKNVFDSMEQYGGIFVYTSNGGSGSPVEVKIDARLIDANGKLNPKLLDPKGNVVDDCVYELIRELEGRQLHSDFMIIKEQRIADYARRFNSLARAGFRYEIHRSQAQNAGIEGTIVNDVRSLYDPNQDTAIFFPHLATAIKRDDFQRLTGLEAILNGDGQFEIRVVNETVARNAIKSIEDSKEGILLDNRMPVKQSISFLGGELQSEEVQKLKLSKRIKIPNDRYITIFPRNQGELMSLHFDSQSYKDSYNGAYRNAEVLRILNSRFLIYNYAAA